MCRVLVDVSAMLMQRSTGSLSALVSQGGAFGLLSVLSNLLQLSSSFQSAIRLLFFFFVDTLLIKSDFINSSDTGALQAH